jgi:hypothetical protein
VCACLGIEHEQPAWNTKYLPQCYNTNILSMSLALKGQITVLSLEVQNCYISQIQEHFAWNRSVERLFVIRHFCLIFSQGNNLKNIRLEFPDILYKLILQDVVNIKINYTECPSEYLWNLWIICRLASWGDKIPKNNLLYFTCSSLSFIACL